jgi:cephalosporin hydroxylase
MIKDSDPKTPEYVLKDLERLMLRIGANEHWYEQTWLGVPVWQLPGDLIRLQNVVFESKPRWIVETGTKFGGSALFFSSMLHLLGLDGGGVLTVDIELRAEAKQLFQDHPLGGLVRAAIEGDAASEAAAARFQEEIARNPGPVMVFLDDNHNADHVYRELQLYSPLVGIDSYLIVADTVFADLAGTPVGAPTDKYPDVATSNPRVAVDRFLEGNSAFKRDFRFSQNGIGNFSDGFLRRTAK